MKVTWKKKENKKRPLGAISNYSNLPFDQQDQETAEDNHKNASSDDKPTVVVSNETPDSESNRKLAESFQSQGNKLAEDGKYREALGKWEAALNLMPESAVVHEQKAQVLLELGDAWSALKAATLILKDKNVEIVNVLTFGFHLIGATVLAPSWAEAWVTLGRAQLNFGEPDSAIESFDKALAIKPDSKEAQDDRHTALLLVKRRKQFHSTSGVDTVSSRYVVGENKESF